MTFIVDLHQEKSILDIFEVRRILEPAAAAIAAGRICEAQLAELRATLDDVDDHTRIRALLTVHITGIEHWLRQAL